MDNYISDLKNQVNHISNKQILIQLLGQTKYDIEKYKKEPNYSNYISQICDIFEDKIDKNKIIAVLDIKNLQQTKMSQIPLNVMNELSLKLDTQLQFKEDTKVQSKQNENSKLQLQQIQEERKKRFYELKEKERQRKLEIKQRRELLKKQEEEKQRIDRKSVV